MATTACSETTAALCGQSGRWSSVGKASAHPPDRPIAHRPAYTDCGSGRKYCCYGARVSFSARACDYGVQLPIRTKPYSSASARTPANDQLAEILAFWEAISEFHRKAVVFEDTRARSVAASALVALRRPPTTASVSAATGRAVVTTPLTLSHIPNVSRKRKARDEEENVPSAMGEIGARSIKRARSGPKKPRVVVHAAGPTLQEQ